MSESSEIVTLVFDGRTVSTPSGVTVAAALANVGMYAIRSSVTGLPRGVLCGMGVCQECRMTIDGVHNRRACAVVVREGMVIDSDLPR
jgi:D-hydroxyproline dehydrogenase subunit gamma